MSACVCAVSACVCVPFWLCVRVQCPEPRAVEFEDLPKLPYLAAVVKVGGGVWERCTPSAVWFVASVLLLCHLCQTGSLLFLAAHFSLACLPACLPGLQESMRELPVSADGTALEVPRSIQLGSYTIPAK